MTTKELLEENEIEDGVLYFNEPEFPDSIIGTTFDTPARVVYDYDKMVEEYMKKFDATAEDAADFICYNCERTAEYMGDKAPIIVYPLRFRGD